MGHAIPSKLTFLQAPSGGIDVDCGKYFYTLQRSTSDEVRCLIDDYSYVGPDMSHPAKPAKSWSKQDAEIAIKLFCQGYDDLKDDDGVVANVTSVMMVDPNATHAPDGWWNQTPEYPERLFFFPKSLQVITVWAAFASVVGPANQHPSWGSQHEFPTNENCNPHEATSFFVGSYSSTCIDAATTALDLCK